MKSGWRRGEGCQAAELRRTELWRRRTGKAGRKVKDARQPSCGEQDCGGGGRGQRADARCTGAEGKIKGGVLTDAALSGAKNKQRLSMCGTRLVCACLPSRVGQGCVNTYKNDIFRLKPKKHYEWSMLVPGHVGVPAGRSLSHAMCCRNRREHSERVMPRETAMSPIVAPCRTRV